MSERRTASSASPAVGRALDVLLHLAGRSGPVRASALARDLEMPRSSLYHILAVLVDRGFVTYVPEEQAYGLGVSSFEIGSAYSRHEPLKRLARPILRNLSNLLGQSVHLGILYGAETVYLLKERPPRGHSGYTDATPVTDVGVRLPAHLTANGRAILAHSGEAHLRAVFPGREISSPAPAEAPGRWRSCGACWRGTVSAAGRRRSSWSPRGSGR
ncbi:IclR family transcriptional regulator [Streptomyces indonesiensis]